MRISTFFACVFMLVLVMPLVTAASYTDAGTSSFSTGSFDNTSIKISQNQVVLYTSYGSRILGTSGLVGYWPFDEATLTGAPGEIKDALGLNDGTAMKNANPVCDGNYSTITQGKVNNALLNTIGACGSWAELSGTGALSNLSNFTVSFWLNMSNATNGWSPAIMAKANTAYWGVDNYTTFYILQQQFSQGLFIYVGHDNGATVLGSYDGINNGQWRNIVFEYNGTAIVLYVDSIFNNEVDAVFTPYTDNSPIQLFSRWNGGGANGSVDELAVWNRALTLAEISDLSVGTNPAPSSTFTSRVFELGSDPVNISINWSYSTPVGTSVLVSTRSGNGTNTSTGWSGWSSNYALPTGSAVTSPQNRYYQYRVQLTTTNNAVTPALTGITLTYNESGTNISYAAPYNINLISNSTTNYNFNVFVNDTYSIVSVTGRYKVGNDPFSSVTALTSPASGVYNATVPYINWSFYPNQNLTLEVTAISNNGSANFTKTVNITEFIDDAPPVIDPILNYTVPQNITINITVTGSDINNQNLVFTTNKSAMSVTALTNTSAMLSWTPNATDVGLHTITVYANDSMSRSNRTFIINVTNINDAPVISAALPITGYHGVMQSLVLTAYDPDAGQNITFFMNPAFFRISTALQIGNNSQIPYTYYGVANFTPADPENGMHNVTFYVSDGIVFVNTTTTMSIDYCGDGTCQATYENATSCSVDCKVPETTDTIALLVPDRNCANQSMTLYSFNATNRFSCYYQGLVEDGLALCEGLDGVNINVYYRNASILIEKASLSSGTNGTVTYTPDVPGEYKFSASKDGFRNSSTIVIVRDCSQDIVVRQDNITKNQTPIKPRVKPQTPPAEELPQQQVAQATWYQLLFFYVLVPVLMAGLLYTSIIFYDVNKDTLPWLLETRIFFYEQRIKYQPQIDKVEKTIAPVLRPVAESLHSLYIAGVKPLVDKVKGLVKK